MDSSYRLIVFLIMISLASDFSHRLVMKFRHKIFQNFQNSTKESDQQGSINLNTLLQVLQGVIHSTIPFLNYSQNIHVFYLNCFIYLISIFYNLQNLPEPY